MKTVRLSHLFLRKVLATFAVLAIIATAFLTISPVYAVTPTITQLTTKVLNAGVLTGSTTVAPTLTASTTVVVGYASSPSTGTISSITDTKGLIWSQVFGAATTPACNGNSACGGMAMSMWWALTGSASGVDTLTITFSVSILPLSLAVDQISVPAVPVITQSGGVGGAPSSKTAGYETITAGSISSSAGDIVMAYDAQLFCTQLSTPATCAGGTSPTNPVQAGNPPLLNYGTADIVGGTSGLLTHLGASAYSVTANTGYAPTSTLGWTGASENSAYGMIIADFTQTGAQAPTCPSQSCSTALGGNTATNVGASLVSNTTYYYLYNTGNESMTLSAFTIAIKNVTAAANGARLLAGIYTAGQVQAPGGGILTGFNNINPGILGASFVWPLTTNAAPQVFVWPANFNVPAGKQFAIAIGVTHNGAFIYTSNAVVTMDNDSADAFLTPGRKTGNLPFSIAQTTVAPTPFAFSVAGLSPIVINSGGGTTTTTVSGSISVTIVQTVTTYSNNGLNPTVNLGNLLLAIVVLLVPALLIATVTKSLLGGILGAVLGVVVGVYIGFIPFYAIVVIALVAVVVLFVGRGNEGDV